MSNIYHPDSGEVLLARFTDSVMIKDSEGKTTSHCDDYWRSKTYVKPGDMFEPKYPIFPQPHQWAATVDPGSSWLDYNKVFVIQIAQCNIDCWYCFVDKDLRAGKEVNAAGIQTGGWFTAEEIYQMWKKSGAKIFRVSGGEPTLASEFLMELHDLLEAKAYEDVSPTITWIDTNMSTGDMFFDAYKAHHEKHCSLETGNFLMQSWFGFGMSGCFKGFTKEDTIAACGQDILDKQFEFARRLVRETDIEPFFYVPDAVGATTNEADMLDFFDRMRHEVDEYAPLRTYVLQVKNYSPTKKDRWDTHTGKFPSGSRPIDVWQALCRGYYEPELCWIPNHQIVLAERKKRLEQRDQADIGLGVAK